MHFIGDISEEDVAVLGKHALTATSILEFGCGGSTQVLANYSRPDAPFTSIDTDQYWLVRTRDNLRRLGIRRRSHVQFKYWNPRDVPPLPSDYDLVFVDGRRDLRIEFAKYAWPGLKVGGHLLWHDCRRDLDLSEIMAFVSTHSHEVEALLLSPDQSNLASIRKRSYLPLRNWQTGKERWELGVGEPPPELPWPLA